MNEHVNGCTGKRKFATREHAVEVNTGIRKRLRGKAPRLHPYVCANCHCWHVSHLSEEENQRRIAAAAAGIARAAKRERYRQRKALRDASKLGPVDGRRMLTKCTVTVAARQKGAS